MPIDSNVPTAPTAIVVDAMEFRRAGVAHFLESWAAGENINLQSLSPDAAHAALRELGECRLVVLNVGSGDCFRTDSVAEIKVLRTLSGKTPLVVIADEDVPENVLAAMQAGADGYFSNRVLPSLAFRILTFVLHGGTYFPRSIVHYERFQQDLAGASGGEMQETCLDETAPTTEGPEGPASDEPASSRALMEVGPRVPTGAAPSLGSLSERQKKILEGLCRGEPNKIIGRALDLPESTVKVHVREIMRKLGVVVGPRSPSRWHG